MHAQAYWYITRLLHKHPNFFKNKKVLEIGSLDVMTLSNPNQKSWRIRDLFENCDYTGVDIGEGPNVDLVCEAHNLNFEDETFDVIVSAECFEHDMFWQLSIKNIIRMLKPGGMFAFTTATTGRPEHGTISCYAGASPYTSKSNRLWKNFYKNFEPKDFLSIEEFSEFRYIEFEKSLLRSADYNNLNDIYFCGIKLTKELNQGQTS
jgi:SAM-dependent methyltransferase